MTLEEQETENAPSVESVKNKAPCLETIYKRLIECNGAVQAIFYDLDYITRTEPPSETPEGDASKPNTTNVNLTTMQQEVDVLRNRIRDCRRKLEKARWG